MVETIKIETDFKKCTLSVLPDRNANPDSVKNSRYRYESGTKKLANKKKFNTFKSWVFSLEGCSLEILLKEA